MRVFVTGASGFVGSAIVKELLQAGHSVLGMVRTGSAAQALADIGAGAHPGNLDDLQSVQAGVTGCDAVIHTAFNHDFSRFKENCEADRRVILALGAALEGSNRPLVITSGTGLINTGRLLTEEDMPPSSDIVPRAASEEAARAVAAKGVNAYITRLPPTVHGKGDHGFIPVIINTAREKQQSVYIGEGQNHWPAVHRLDAAALYRLVVEKQPAQRVYHAVGEQGIPFKEIAAAIGRGLHIPTVSMQGSEAEAHFGWFTHFASLGSPASSARTSEVLGWQPHHPGLLEELVPGIYF
ncbi:MAG TPA: SDR family oxidoreductase [Chitinophagaceae bacterium]|nr:SDR family oxidoreductase [Chitinophagaceae bacterium]